MSNNIIYTNPKEQCNLIKKEPPDDDVSSLNDVAYIVSASTLKENEVISYESESSTLRKPTSLLSDEHSNASKQLTPSRDVGKDGKLNNGPPDNLEGPKGISLRYLFLFYNPTSGGNAAQVLSDSSSKQAELFYGSDCVRLNLYDIRDGPSGNKRGFVRLKEIIDSMDIILPRVSLVRVVVGGGDGTVMWCISELRMHNIDLDKVAIGVTPFGTGNDFARALAWDLRFQHGINPRSELRRLVFEWVTADIVPHDLWDVHIELQNIGTIKKVDSQTRYKQVITETNERGQNIPIRVADYKMCNYFSIGVESRIGVGFDRYRTSSRFWNKLRYAAEGLKKSVFKKTLKINEIVTCMTMETSEGKSIEIFHCLPTSSAEKADGDAISSFSNPPSQKTYKKNSPPIDSSKQPCQRDSSSSSSESIELLCSDSSSQESLHERPFVKMSDDRTETQQKKTSLLRPPLNNSLRPYKDLFEGGQIRPRSCPTSPTVKSMNFQRSNVISRLSPPLLPAASLIAINIPSFAAGLDIWSTAHRLGVDSTYSHPQNKTLLQAHQVMGDGLLEFLTFSSVASMGVERMSAFHGRGKRICQGPGPFCIHFSDMPRDWRVYYQIDGEFYVMSCPQL